jgi:hypothetical protein
MWRTHNSHCQTGEEGEEEETVCTGCAVDGVITFHLFFNSFIYKKSLIYVESSFRF